MKNLKKIVTLLLVIVAVFSFVACKNSKTETPQSNDNVNVEGAEGTKLQGLWADAKYTEDTTFGEGAKTLKIVVEAEDKKITFTVKTDKETVGDALMEHKLIDGDQGDYGLYVKYVNGIKADYDTDKAYWSFNKNGEYMMTGVDTTNFADGDQYELVYTKG